MEPDKSLHTLFNEALEREHGVKRTRYLEEACGNDAALRERVEKLLRANDEAGGFFSQPSKAAPSSLPSGIGALPVTEQAGDMIGRYKLLQQIGEGGCGVVYMAEQEEPVRRRVALKVIKLGMDTKQVVARFEAERQALAMMDHPNIAKVLDAGTTGTACEPERGRSPAAARANEPSSPELLSGAAAPGDRSRSGMSAGRPFFVMELVRGIRITEFCDAKQLSTHERLDLFLQVCAAIQHAHQKGVIHRDIKPSNILVTIVDGKPVPKIIDFGIAKATNNQRLTDKTLFTAFEQFIGTPAYMSPEQAEMSGVDIDTRTDIYSLGVVLYELLTGRTPFDAETLLRSGIDGIRRTIREQEPPKPSTRLNALDDADLTTTANARHTEAPKLVQAVRGDLDWIVMKCLEKDRNRRYETANGLAMDIRRHRQDEPIVARPPSRLYEFQKTVRRHKFGFAAAAALMGVLAIGVLVSTFQALRATRAEREQSRLRQRAEANEQRAESEAAKSRQVATFLEDMLKGIGPSVALGRDTTMLREILDKTVERLATDMRGQPEVQAELRTTIGHIYHELGEFQKANEMHGEALRVRKALFGETNLWVAASLSAVAYALDELDRPDEAQTMQRAALAMRRELLGNDHLDVASSLERLADTLSRQQKMAESEVIRRESLAIRRKLSGNESLEVADTLNDLSTALVRQGKLQEAEAVVREALAICRKLLGDEHPSLATSLFRLSRILEYQGRLEEAETAAREALAMRRKLLGNEHAYVRSALDRLASVLQRQRKYAEAEAAQREWLALRRATLGEDDAYVVHVLTRLATVLREQGKVAEAEATLREVLTTRKKLFGGTHPDVAGTLGDLVIVLRAQNKLAEAETAAREALAIRRQSFGDQHREVGNSLAALAGVLREQGRLSEAEVAWREELALERKLSGDEHPFVANSLVALASVLRDQGKLADAESLLREALAMRRKLLGNEHPDVRTSVVVLTSLLLIEEKFADAEPLARECLAFREKQSPDDWLTFNAQAMLGGSLLGQLKYAEAEPLLLSAYEGMKQREQKIPAAGRPRLKEALQRLVQLYEATEKPDQAAGWKEKLAAFEKTEAERPVTVP